MAVIRNTVVYQTIATKCTKLNKVSQKSQLVGDDLMALLNFSANFHVIGTAHSISKSALQPFGNTEYSQYSVYQSYIPFGCN